MGNELELNIQRTCTYCINLDRLSHTPKNKPPNPSGLKQQRIFFFFLSCYMFLMGWPGLCSVSSLSSPHNLNCLGRHHLARCQMPQQCEKNILQGQTLVIKYLTWKCQVTSALGRTSQRGPGNTILIYG